MNKPKAYNKAEILNSPIEMMIEQNTNYAFKHTCPHLCEYCYANVSKELALKNWKQAKETEWKSETITGK